MTFSTDREKDIRQSVFLHSTETVYDPLWYNYNLVVLISCIYVNIYGIFCAMYALGIWYKFHTHTHTHTHVYIHVYVYVRVYLFYCHYFVI